MTAPTHPRPDVATELHPPPWQWTEIGGVFSLRDARGVRILLGDDVGGVHVDDPGAGAALAAAPHMEALLDRMTELVNRLTPFAFAYAADHPECNIPTKIEIDDAIRKAGYVFARLDAARKAGG